MSRAFSHFFDRHRLIDRQTTDSTVIWDVSEGPKYTLSPNIVYENCRYRRDVPVHFWDAYNARCSPGYADTGRCGRLWGRWGRRQLQAQDVVDGELGSVRDLLYGHPLGFQVLGDLPPLFHPLLFPTDFEGEIQIPLGNKHINHLLFVF